MRRFRRLVDRYKDRVYGFAYHYVGNREDADEVTQDVLLRLWDHYQSLDEDRMASWIMRVTRNLCIDCLRKRRARSGHETASAEQPEYQHATTGLPDPQQQLTDQELKQQILEAMRELPEPQRSIVQLRELHASSYEEIGAAMDLPLNTVKVYLHRARRKLREILSQQRHYEYES